MLMNSALAYPQPILVVEDSDEDFDTLIESLRITGRTRTIHRAVSGSACLEMLVGEGKFRLSILPALILMDLNSHGVDGREALVAIKATPGLKQIPLVVMTTSANAKDVSFCYEAGANAYHVKPVRHDQYLLLLASLMDYWLDSVVLNGIVTKGI
jgi:two-component system, response regulator